MLRMRRLSGLVLLLASCSGPEPNTQSKDPYERYLGVREIGQARDRSSEAELVRLLDDPHYLVLTGVLESMAEIGRKEYLPYVLPKLRLKEKDPTDPKMEREIHPMVRAQACETVAVIAGEEGLENVLGILDSDPDPGVRRSAVKTIVAHYGKVQRAREALARTVGDADPSVAFAAHKALEELTGRTKMPRSKDAWMQAIRP